MASRGLSGTTTGRRSRRSWPSCPTINGRVASQPCNTTKRRVMSKGAHAPEDPKPAHRPRPRPDPERARATCAQATQRAGSARSKAHERTPRVHGQTCAYGNSQRGTAERGASSRAEVAHPTHRSRTRPQGFPYGVRPSLSLLTRDAVRSHARLRVAVSAGDVCPGFLCMRRPCHTTSPKFGSTCSFHCVRTRLPFSSTT